MKALTGRIDAIENVSAAAKANTDEILAILRGAKSIWGYCRKYGPHGLTFAIGAAVAGGYVSAELGKSFLAVFGL